MLSPLARAEVIDAPDLIGIYLDAEALVDDIIQGRALDGFTLSPHGAAHTRILDGSHAVALQGSDLLLPHDSSFASGETPHDDTRALMTAWLDMMMPAFDSGHAWVGGYMHSDGRLELNVTVLFKPEFRAEAIHCCEGWDQVEMWTFDKDHQDGGYATPTGGEGGGSVFADPDAPDHLGQPRTLLKEMLEPAPRRRWWQFREH